MQRHHKGIVVLGALLFGVEARTFSAMPAAGPGDCHVSVEKGKALLEQQQFKAAEDLLRAASATCAGDSELFGVLGLAYDFDQHFDQAQAAFEKALTVDPANVIFRNNLASSYLRAGKRANGIAEMERVLRIDPHNLTANVNLGTLYLNENQYQRAVQFLEAADAGHSEDPVLLVELTEAYVGAGKAEAALRAAQQASRLAGPDPRIHYSLAVALAKAGKYERAVEEFEAIPQSERDATADLDLGMALSKLQRYDEARKAYLDAIRQEPSNPDPYLRIGLDVSTSGNAATAVDWLTQAHDKAPERTDISSALAEELIDARNFEAARSLLIDALQIHPNEPSLLGAQGDLYLNRGNYTEAADAYARSLRSQPQAVNTRLSLAKCYLALNQNAQAEKELTRVLAADPKNAEAQAQRGRLALAADQPDMALNWIRKALANDEHNLTANEEYATIMVKRGKADEARATLEKLIQRNPMNPRFHYLLGQALSKSGDAAGAQKEFEMSQKLTSGSSASSIKQ